MPSLLIQIAIALQFVMMGLSAGGPTLANVTYAVLGPFPEGNREVADPLEAFGGIDVAYSLFLRNGSSTMLYPTELADGGNVTWSNATADGSGNVNMPFSTVRFDFLNAAFGPFLLGVQGWAIANFTVEEEGTYLLQCFGFSNYYVDGIQYRADPYADNWWFGADGWLKWPIALSAGVHMLKVHFEGTQFQCEFVESAQDLVKSPFIALTLENPTASSINPGVAFHTPDVVGGVLAGNCMMISVVNGGENPLVNGSVRLLASDVVYQNGTVISSVPASAVASFGPIQSNQAIPVTVTMTVDSTINCPGENNTQFFISLQLIASDESSGAKVSTLFNTTLNCKPFGSSSPYRFTFLGYDGTIQYAAVIPPAKPCSGRVLGCPLLFSTHGASVDAASPTWTGAYQAQDNAWILLPTNRGAFGFDWQGPGRVDGLMALSAFVNDLPGVPASLKSAYQIDVSNILFAGHSMGGHGCLVYSTAYADRAVGVACAAGWIKMWQYTPYWANMATSFMDSSLTGVLMSSVGDYDTDLFVPHLSGIDFVGRMGGDDQDVPPWNLQRFVRVIQQTVNSTATAVVNEVPGQPHWWGGVVDDAYMQAFIQSHLYAGIPSLPASLDVVSFGLWKEGRGGIRVLQNRKPFTLGRIHAAYDSNTATYTLKSRNIRRFGLTETAPVLKQVLIDGQPLPVATIASGSHYCRTDSKWSVCADDSFMYYERSAANGGPGAQTLYSGRIIAVYGTLGGSAATQALRTLAVNTANALFAQIKLLVTIVPDTDFNFADVSSASSSILLFGGPSLNSMSSLVIKGGAASGCMVSSTFARAVAFTAGDASVAIGPEVYGEPGYGFTGFGSVNITCGGTDSYRDQKLESPLLAQLSASPLSPPVPFVRIPGQSLALLFAGADINGVSDAVSQADVGQSNSVLPDYIVTTPSTRWKGVGGLLAAGFWGNSWEWRADLSYSTDPSE